MKGKHMRTRALNARRARGFVLFSALLLLAACGTDGGAGEDGGTSGATITIGVVLSLTGDASTLGVPEGDTIRMYQDEINEVGGVPVEWVIVDDESDSTTAVTQTKRLIDQGAAAILCCTISPNSMAILDTVQQEEVPNISLGAAATITNPVEERQWVFKTPASDSLTIGAAAENMFDHGIQRVAFLGFDDAYGESGRTQFELIAGERGIEIVAAEAFGREDRDVTPQLTRLRQQNPDAYIIWATPPGANIAQRNLRNLGITEPVYQSTGAANREFLNVGGEDVEGVRIGMPKALVGETLSDDDPQRVVILAYKERYEAEHGEGTVNIFGAQTLDAMLVLEDSIARALEGGADPGDLAAFRAALRDAIESAHDVVGLSGIYRYGPDDHEGLDARCCIVVEVRNNNWSLAD
jgi:branched-chain amino acid transport system substrate-binding protein